MTRLTTKTTLLFAACSLVSGFAFAELETAAPGAVNSQLANGNQLSAQTSIGSGSVSTSAGLQQAAQSQLEIKQPAMIEPAQPVANAATDTTPAQVPSTSNSAAAQESVAATTNATGKSSAQITNNLTTQTLSAGADKVTALTESTKNASAEAIKNQADFVKATAQDVQEHLKTSLTPTTDVVRHVQSSTTAAVSEAVRSSLDSTVNTAATAVLNQEINNQVNTAVTQEIGNTLKSTLDSSVNNSLKQSLGL